ncbi:MAG: hypothetical protein ACP5Q0_01105 [Halothiobacillus sp.]
MDKSPLMQAVWNLRWMSLFMVGPALGIVLVDRIFGLPIILWWSAGGVSVLMLGIFTSLVLKERRLIRQNAPTKPR